jgi:hypothetical protein
LRPKSRRIRLSAYCLFLVERLIYWYRVNMEATKMAFLQRPISISWHLILQDGILLDNADVGPARDRARLALFLVGESFELAFFTSAPNRAAR